MWEKVKKKRTRGERGAEVDREQQRKREKTNGLRAFERKKREDWAAESLRASRELRAARLESQGRTREGRRSKEEEPQRHHHHLRFIKKYEYCEPEEER